MQIRLQYAVMVYAFSGILTSIVSKLVEKRPFSLLMISNPRVFTGYRR